MACSNSFRALKLADNDRRWFVPEVTEEKWPHQKWVEFNTWLGNGELEAICFWAHDYVKRHGHVQPGIEAPESVTKQRSVVAAMSDGEKIIYDLGTSLVESKKQRVVRLDRIRSWLAEEKSGRRYGYDGSKYLETAETIARKLKLAGLKICKRRFKEEGKQFQVVANFEVGEEETWETLKTKCIEPDRSCTSWPTRRPRRRRPSYGVRFTLKDSSWTTSRFNPSLFLLSSLIKKKLAENRKIERKKPLLNPEVAQLLPFNVNLPRGSSELEMKRFWPVLAVPRPCLPTSPPEARRGSRSRENIWAALHRPGDCSPRLPGRLSKVEKN